MVISLDNIKRVILNKLLSRIREQVSNHHYQDHLKQAGINSSYTRKYDYYRITSRKVSSIEYCLTSVTNENRSSYSFRPKDVPKPDCSSGSGQRAISINVRSSFLLTRSALEFEEH
ncbi:unnamed protein product [Ceratitis capitata]|uniref:(Mediterranean fruit fly) hypothetical protein n=1 Tax=Ceratitis capitata TaxID=7213 RepID=A0A811UY01_CERCA|nr:unnamed protein product [Ceratitis capitata]